MPRYFFHFVSADHVLKDTDGIELAGLRAAHGHALRLVHQMRIRLPEANHEWLIEISDETGKRPLVMLPSLRGLSFKRVGRRPARALVPTISSPGGRKKGD